MWKNCLKISENKSLKIMPGHICEFNPYIQDIKDYMDSGLIGDIIYISMYRLNHFIRKNNISVIWDIAVHDFSILFKLINEKPSKFLQFQLQ